MGAATEYSPKRVLPGEGIMITLTIRSRIPATTARKTPRWQTGIDNMTPWYAIGLGPLTQPWALIAAGVSVIVEAKLSSWQSYLALVLGFWLVGNSIYYLVT